MLICKQQSLTSLLFLLLFYRHGFRCERSGARERRERKSETKMLGTTSYARTAERRGREVVPELVDERGVAEWHEHSVNNSLLVISALMERFGDHDALWGVELLNEPGET